MSSQVRGEKLGWKDIQGALLAALRAGDVNVVGDLGIWISAARPQGASDDQVQDCVLGLLLSFRGEHGAARLQAVRDWPAYLARMVRNQTMRHQRAEPDGARPVADRREFALPCPFGAPEIVEQRELIARAIRAQDRLPPKQRAAWRMHLDSVIDAIEAVPPLTADERHRFVVALSCARRRVRSELGIDQPQLQRGSAADSVLK